MVSSPTRTASITSLLQWFYRL